MSNKEFSAMMCTYVLGMIAIIIGIGLWSAMVTIFCD